ncbi:MAG TPA: asparagine synthase (glutamine-hydrolyzing) [Candidatus Binataceae bacterium]|nr:asparagine synthase (glutamine-hydrolyzing) [Candidatus Binataceae bacterium]
MCGIAGVWTPADEDGRGAVAAIVHQLEHRGPDDQGLESIHTANGCLTLGFRRLSIIDLSSAGHQPMFDPETGNWIVFNGEIYNFRELRAELRALGENDWRSSSDTEVILKAYRRFDERCLERLEGMFALALWDARRERLLLARDRLGIKPLYYHYSAHRLIFASELRAILASGLIDAAPSGDAIDSYLELGAVQEPLTMIEGVRSIRAGSYAIVTAAGFAEHCYWNLSSVTSQAHSVKDFDAVAHVRTLLEQAVARHLIADVPVGVFLSGGLDSTSLVALSKSAAGDQVRTLSVVFDEPEYSERRYSSLAARTFNTLHTEIRLDSQELRNLVEPALAAADQPTVDGVNTYVVARAAKLSGLKVVLSGLGGDELFGGYSSFRWNRRLQLLRRVPLAIRRPLALAARLPFAGSDGWTKMIDWMGEPAGCAPYYAMRQLFGPSARAALLDGHAGNRDLTAERDGAISDDPINEISRLELSYYLRNMLLRDSDAMSMAHGVELRVPMLDGALVEYVLGLPGRMKMSKGQVKPLLARALAAEMPFAIACRPKVGFELPFQSWLRGPWSKHVEAVLLDRGSGGRLGNYLAHEMVESIWRRFQTGQGHWSRPWALYSLKQWGALNLSDARTRS